MKKFTIFLTILIFLIGGLIGGYFIGQNADTIKSWFEKDPTQQEQEKPGVDDPVIPEEPEKVEITDFAFCGSIVYDYSGESTTVEIPTSYSVEFSLADTQHFDTYFDFETFANTCTGEGLYAIGAWFLGIKVIPDKSPEDSSYQEYFYYGNTISMDIYRNKSLLFPATIEFYDTTFYEGNDFIVDTVDFSFFVSSYSYDSNNVLTVEETINIETLILPSTIIYLDGPSMEWDSERLAIIYLDGPSMEWDSERLVTLKEVVILNDEKVIRGSSVSQFVYPENCKIYVPDSLYDLYKSPSNLFQSPDQLYKLSELGVVS